MKMKISVGIFVALLALFTFNIKAYGEVTYCGTIQVEPVPPFAEVEPRYSLYVPIQNIPESGFYETYSLQFNSAEIANLLETNVGNYLCLTGENLGNNVIEVSTGSKGLPLGSKADPVYECKVVGETIAIPDFGAKRGELFSFYGLDNFLIVDDGKTNLTTLRKFATGELGGNASAGIIDGKLVLSLGVHDFTIVPINDSTGKVEIRLYRGAPYGSVLNFSMSCELN